MPRYNRTLASKRYVNKRIEEEKWSRQYIVNVDFDNATVVNSVTYYNLSEDIFLQMIAEGIFADAPVDTGTDGARFATVEYKIDYIRWRLRAALGEDETLSAISQTVRLMLFRSAQDNHEIANDGFNVYTDDVDGSFRYDLLYGNKFGYYSDKMQYIHSWAADSDTTAGGQVIFKGFKKLKFSDTAQATPTVAADGDVNNEKGCLVFAHVGDDPTGTNAALYGFIEIGWRYKT